MTRLYLFQEIYVVARIPPKRKVPLQGRFIKSVFIADLDAPNASLLGHGRAQVHGTVGI